MQSRIGSMIEVAFNYASGILIAWCVWTWVATPVFHIHAPAHTGIGVVALFTGVSIVRSYAWRRFFNWWHHRRHA